MAQSKQTRIDKLRADVKKLRESYTGAVTSANQSVYEGIEQLADHELEAIKTHYEAVLKNLKKLRQGGDPRDMASAQLKLLQDTIDRIMKNARESLTILDKTRKQIATDLRKNIKAAESQPKSSGSKAKSTRSSTAKKTGTSAGSGKKSATRKSSARRSTSTSRSTAARKGSAKSSGAKKTAASRKSGTAAKSAKPKSTRSTAAKKAGSTRKSTPSSAGN